MHFVSFNFVLVALGAAFCAALTVFFNIRGGRDSWDEGRGALAAQFIGWWIADTIFFWSFTADSAMMRWTMWGVAVVVAIVGISLGVYLAKPPKVQVAPDSNPYGKNIDPRP
jgi:hypothetical protein